MDQLDEAALGLLPPDRLFDYALAHFDAADDDNPAWPAIVLLWRQATPAMFDRAARLSAAPDLSHRCLGLHVIAQLGLPDRAFHDQAAELLLALLETETKPMALNAIAFGLGHRYEPRAIAPLAALRGHLHPEVRAGVVHALLGHDDPLAIETLILLSADPEDHIRDWATFGPGTQTAADTPAIREALAARLDDAHGPPKGEALVGLAQRKDPSQRPGGAVAKGRDGTP